MLKAIARGLAYPCLREKLQKGSFYPLAARVLVRRRIKKMCRPGSLPLPQIVNIETTNACNANCGFCYQPKMKRERVTMEEGLYKKIIDECLALGIRSVKLCIYGEPLMDKDICFRVRYAKEKGAANVGFFTNAALLDTGKAKALIAAGLDEICISIDGASKETYEKMRKGLDYGEVSANIESLLKIRGSPLKVHLFFASFPENRKEESLFKRRWKGRVESVNIGSGYKTDLPAVGRKNFAPCPYLWKRMFVLSNADVALCCQDHEGSSAIGNMRSSGLEEIWRGETIAEYRRLHLAGESGSIAACSRCELNLWMRWLVPFRF